MTGPLSITVFVVALLAAIMLHEAGHFVTARRFGMRADRFFLGFGPTLVSTRRGETEYGVKAFPIGGFVRIVGMSPTDERLPGVIDAVLDDAGGPDSPRADAGARDPDAPTGDDPDDGQPAADEPSRSLFERLEDALRVRGAPAGVTERIVRRARANLDGVTDPATTRALLLEIIETEVDDTGRIGDLHHRLLHGDEDRFFHDRPAWQRAIVLASGSATHFLLAIALLIGAYAFLPQWTGGFASEVAEVEPGSPADVAGLEPGDRVLAVEGVRSDEYERVREAIRERPGQPTTLVVVRDGEERFLRVVPEPVETPDEGIVGVVGFRPAIEMVRMGPMEAIEHALIGAPQPGNPGGFGPMFVGSIQGLGRVFSPSGLADIAAQATGQRERDLEGAVSLVGAASIAGQVTDTPVGITLFVGLLALVNIFVGIFNLVPLPPLDGGHLAALGVERSVNAIRRLRGRQPDFAVDPRTIAAVAVPVLAILSVVVLALLWLDITDPIRLN
jgi:regulator of sigma E protease